MALVEQPIREIHEQLTDPMREHVNLAELSEHLQFSWNRFEDICRIPRETGNEIAIGNYLSNFAREHGFEPKIDKAGNILVEIPESSPQFVYSPGLIFQTHQDMVADPPSGKPGSPAENGVEPEVYKDNDEYWVRSKGHKTSLGADNGIGVALSLSLIHNHGKFDHGPLAFLFTTHEEKGMEGAIALDREIMGNLLRYHHLINLDSEKEGKAAIGSAGAGYTDMDYHPQYEEAKGRVFVKIDITGFPGGHSGTTIHEDKPNAIKYLGDKLDSINIHHQSRGGVRNLQLASIEGGSATNAIPDNASAVIAVDKDQLAYIREMITAQNKAVQKYKGEKNFPEVKSEVLEVQTTQVMKQSMSDDILGMIRDLPHGVTEMNPNITGLVDTSTCLSTIEMPNKVHPNTLRFSTMTRSPDIGKIEKIRREIWATALKYHVPAENISQPEPFGGWTADPNSPLIRQVAQLYGTLTQKPFKTEAVHAGLECGAIVGKYNHLQAISIGPTIDDAHKATERVNFASTTRFMYILEQLIADMSKQSLDWV